MAAKGKQNEPPPQPIIVKKIIEEGHGGHHGGAWKVAYADFVTAMMAFFMVMWIMGRRFDPQPASSDALSPELAEAMGQGAGRDQNKRVMRMADRIASSMTDSNTVAVAGMERPSTSSPVDTASQRARRSRA